MDEKKKDILGGLPIQQGGPFSLKVQQIGQVAPVKILEGPAPRTDGYHMREEYGMPMTREQYKNVQDVQRQYTERANKYLADATADLDRQVAERREALSKVKTPNIPGYKGPNEVTIWASGDGDKPQAYRFPAESAEKILKEMTKNGYYHYTRHSDGSYGIAFGRYGKEGYEALNEAQRAYSGNLQSAQASYDAQRRAALSMVEAEKEKAAKALSESERGARARIQDQYNYLAGLFGTEMADLAKDWEQKKANNSAAIQQLVSGGVLQRKVGVVG